MQGCGALYGDIKEKKRKENHSNGKKNSDNFLILLGFFPLFHDTLIQFAELCWYPVLLAEIIEMEFPCFKRS